MTFNYIAILIICVGVIILLYFGLFRSHKNEIKMEDQKYKMEYILLELRSYFSRKLNDKLTGFRKSGEDHQKREHLKLELQRAMRSCSHGDSAAKAYVKEHIKEWLLNEYRIEAANINKILPFNCPEKLTVHDQFDILLYCYKKQYQENGLEKLISDFNWDRQDKNGVLSVTEETVIKSFQYVDCALNFADQLDIVVQKIYQQYKGHGSIDEIRDMNIDGISGGVSGRLEEIEGSTNIDIQSNGLLQYNSIWIFYHGQMMRLEFLGFGSEHELERVCKNIYRYGNPGQLSAAKGFMANEMKDGSRVIVVRPPFAESWAFFIRKFGKSNMLSVNELICEENAELLIHFLNYIVKSCQVFGITGEQGCGKTTLLKSLIQFIHPGYTLRVQELIFELHLRNLYPERNIVSFKETDGVSGRDGLDLQKKTDGSVNILGEVATAPVASWLVMVSQVASKFTIFTHHAKTTEHLIMSLRNDLMLAGGFHNEKIAEEQVRMAIRFDVHMQKQLDGHRCVQKVTEILQKTEANDVKTRDIIVLENGSYRLNTSISEQTIQDMCSSLTKIEQEDFLLRYGGGEKTA